MGSTEVDLERLRSDNAGSSPGKLQRVALIAGVVGLAYYLGAVAGFVQPRAVHGFANLWLSNALLLGVLLMTPRRQWWAYAATAVLGQVLGGRSIGVAPVVLAVESCANLGQAFLSAWLMRRYIAPSAWFERLRDTNWFIALAGLLIPAAVALAACGVLQWLGASDDFWQAWRMRYRANTVAVLTLTPMTVLIWNRLRTGTLWPRERRSLEAFLLIFSLGLIAALLLVPSPILALYELPLVYLPIPFFLWAATRFGLAAMSAAVLALGSILIWTASNQAGVFSTGALLVDGADIDLLLIVSTIPLMLLAVAFEEKRHVLKQVQLSKDNFKRLAESTAAIPWEADADNWQFTYVGPQAESLLGLPLSRWLSDGFFGLRFHPDDREATLGQFAAVVASGEQAELQYRMTDADDEVVWVNDIVHCERLPTGGKRLRGFMVDATERMRAAHELQLMRERMTQASRIATVGELTASVSHDLYQPLTAILHNAEVAEALLSETNPDTAELRRIMADIVDDDSRAREILRRMRTLMRSGEIVQERLDMQQLIRSTLDLVSTEAAMRSVRVEFVAEPAQFSVFGDPVHLQQMIMNLLLNAFDALSECPEMERQVAVRLEQEDEAHLLLTVTDSGPGIPQAAMANLFRPFQTTKADGLGVGLSITRRIAEAHGGGIWAERGPAGGARFRVRLPLARHPGLQERRAPESSGD